MRGNSSAEAPPWWEVTLDWPVEHVPCQLQVVEPRRLTALEWAVLRVMEAFGDAPPSLEETVRELGIGEARFLTDVLDVLVTQEALEPRPGVEEPGWLPDVVFTERGRQLFRKGQVDGEPSSPGYPLCFDVLTDEPLHAEVKAASRPRCPIIDPERLPAVREEVGLERVRAIVREFGPAVGGADAFIRSVRVLPPAEATGRQRSGHGWVTHPLVLALTPQGRFALRTPSLSAMQRSRLLEYTLDRWFVPARAVTGAWAPHASFRRTRQPLGAWLAQTEQLVPVSGVLQEARRLIASARREVLLHGAWAAAPGLAEALTNAATRGVAVYVLGAPSTRVVTWLAAAQRAPGFVLEVAGPEGMSGALAVDGGEALLLDEVLAEVEEFGRYAFEVAGVTRARAAALGTELGQTLLGALPASTPGEALPVDVRHAHDTGAVVQRLLGEPQLQLDLARFALHPSGSGWAGVEAWLASRCAGVDRVAAIQHVAELAGRLAPDATPSPWRDAGAAAWRAFFSAVSAAPPGTVPDSVLQALLKLAPQDVTGEAVLKPLVARWVTPVPATRSPEALRLLGRLRQLVEARWQGAATRCPGFHAALARCLEAEAPTPDGQPLAELARLVASIAPAAEAQTWGWAVAALWPAPIRLQEFGPWQQRHEPLRALLGPSLTARFAEQWRALIQAEPARTSARMAEQLRCIQGVLTAPEALGFMLAVPGPEPLLERVERLVQLRLASRTVWTKEAPKDEFWSQQLQPLLTVPPEGYSAEVHGPLLAELARRLRDWQGMDAVLRTWSRALLGTLPPPVRAEGVAWWLEALRGAAPVLGAELQRLPPPVVSQHVRALREARQGSTPLWEEVRDAWQKLGLEPSSLENMLEPPPAATPGDARKHKKREKKR
jgi:hypothetical protein